MDADVPVDAQNAPTETCKTAQNAVSQERPHPSSVSRKDEQRKDRTLAARRVILISDRGLSLGHFSRAEVGQFWRASTRHGMNRCRYKGDDGMKRWVGLAVIADNLINIGRVLATRPQSLT